MNETFSKLNCERAQYHRDALIAEGKNPTLADIRAELRRNGLRCSETQTAELLLGVPLDSGRRGTTGTSAKADISTRNAARLSRLAEDSGDPDQHDAAAEAHATARSQHLACANYHLQQANYHRNQANPAGLDGSNAADFAAVTFHCPSCNSDFDMEDAEEVAGSDAVKCPECGAHLNKESTKLENTETTKQADGTARPAAAAKPSRYDPLTSVLCKNCGNEYRLLPGEACSDCVTCPKCNEKINVSSARQEKLNESGEPTAPDENNKLEETKLASRRVQSACAPLCCARSLPSLLGSAAVPDVILYFPAGLHRISPSSGGKPVTVVVEINELSAEQMEEQRQAMEASGGKPFFSVQHNTQIAAFWPTKFFWDTRPDPTGAVVSGVWASGGWSQAGREAVEGKNFRSFSPTFFVDKISTDPNDPAHVACNLDAPLNFGALENDPAFLSMSPLWHDSHQERA